LAAEASGREILTDENPKIASPASLAEHAATGTLLATNQLLYQRVAEYTCDL
jgi:hypothetical protein